MSAAISNNNRRVHFVPENDTVFEIESCKDFTRKEIRDAWFTRSWLDKVGNKRIDAADEWEADKPSDLYLRGLEQYTKDGEELYDRNVEQCKNSVMEEQEVQWCIGEDDYDRIAAVSREASRLTKSLALLRAEEDRIEAQRVYRGTPTQTIRKPLKHHRIGMLLLRAEEERREAQKAYNLMRQQKVQKRTKQSGMDVSDHTEATSICSDQSCLST